MENKEKQETMDSIFEKPENTDYGEILDMSNWAICVLAMFSLFGTNSLSDYTVKDIDKRLAKLEGKTEIIEKLITK